MHSLDTGSHSIITIKLSHVIEQVQMIGFKKAKHEFSFRTRMSDTQIFIYFFLFS